MKKTFCILAIFFSLIPNTVLSAERPDPTAYIYAASFYEKFTCVDGTSFNSEMFERSKILQYEFIKNRTSSQKITQVCAKGLTAYVLREDNGPAGRKIRSGAYFFSPDARAMLTEDLDFLAKHQNSNGTYSVNTYGKRYVETKSHDFTTVCEIQDSSNEKEMKYLCYNPTVASDHDNGKEFLFKFKSRRSYVRDCEVHFPRLPNEVCGKWEKVK